MTHITAIGEILIDLTQSGRTEKGIPQFDANPGGAPANLAVAASLLGASCAFIGKVGRDSFGALLRDTLGEKGVDTAFLLEDTENPTTLAVVALDTSGERSFSFYRDESADVALSPEELPRALLENTKILHFGSVSLTADPARTATLEAVKMAKNAGAIISYDPNYRASLWSDKDTAILRMKQPLRSVDILKVSDEELPLLTGTEDLELGAAMLADLGIRLVLITLGEKGAFYRFHGRTGHIPGVPCVVGDTNGAGDTFLGAVLAQLEDLDRLTRQELEQIIRYANKAASITTSRHGAIPAMPTYEEVFH